MGTFSRVGSAANLIVGIWLFCSAYFWRDVPEQAANAGVVGAVVVATSLAALYGGHPELRLVNLALSIWLFASLWILGGNSAAMVANHMLASVLLFSFSAPAEESDALAPPGRA